MAGDSPQGHKKSDMTGNSACKHTHTEDHVMYKQSSFFLPNIYFIYFPCLIALAGTSTILLKRSGERRYSCLDPDLSRKSLSFSPLNIMLVTGFL